MAKFIINKHSQSPRQIEAAYYQLLNGFFHFYDNHSSQAEIVLTYKAEAVTSIWREPDQAQA